MRLALILAICVIPSLALAAGDDDDFNPPKPSETTRKCKSGFIWDTATRKCVRPNKSSKNNKALMRDVRELAYAGRFPDATLVLDRLDQTDPWVLTYRGFVARKLGDQTGANKYYLAALAEDPNHLLARSYMGQGFVEAGDLDAARLQLSEIRQRGGRGTWPEFALRSALDSGKGFSY